MPPVAWQIGARSGGSRRTPSFGKETVSVSPDAAHFPVKTPCVPVRETSQRNVAAPNLGTILLPHVLSTDSLRTHRLP